MTKNNWINTFQKSLNSQKGYMLEKYVNGKVALKDTRCKGRSLSIIWLDLASAYGSVPHMLILFAGRRCKILEDWITLLMKYYNGLWAGTSASGISYDWH